MDGGYILVVDDESEHRDLIREELEAMGYATEGASNGREALDAIEERLPSAVLLDLRMPVMNGFEMLEEMKRWPRTRAIPVLVISGYGFEWEADLIGAAGYVPKPVDVDVLRDRLRALAPPPGQESASLH